MSHLTHTAEDLVAAHIAVQETTLALRAAEYELMRLENRSNPGTYIATVDDEDWAVDGVRRSDKTHWTYKKVRNFVP